MGGGGFSNEPENPLLDEFVLSLARHPRPRVCFVPTASGDAEGYIARFYRSFAALECRPSDLRLFFRELGDLESFVLAQAVVYVGGGSTANPSRSGARTGWTGSFGGRGRRGSCSAA
jgi:peptidase E